MSSCQTEGEGGSGEGREGLVVRGVGGGVREEEGSQGYIALQGA